MDLPLRSSTNSGGGIHNLHGIGMKLDATKRLSELAETLRIKKSSLRTIESQKVQEICERCHDIAAVLRPIRTKTSRNRKVDPEQQSIHHQQIDEIRSGKNELEIFQKRLIAYRGELDMLRKSGTCPARDQALSSDGNIAKQQEFNTESISRTRAELEELNSAIKHLLEENFPMKAELNFPAGCPTLQIPRHSGFFHRGARGCIVVIMVLLLFSGLSLFLGVFEMARGRSMGDAFTLSAWLIAVGTLVASAVEAYHYPHCECWKHDVSAMDGQKDIELQSLARRID